MPCSTRYPQDAVFFDAVHEVFTRQASVVDRVAHRPAGVADLGRDDRFVAPAGKRLPEVLLGHPQRVDVGGIEAVDAQIKGVMDQLDALRLAGIPPKGVSPQRDL